MAKKKMFWSWLVAIWLSFVQSVVTIVLGSSLLAGALVLPLAPMWLTLSIAWTLIVVGVLVLIFQIFAIAKGLLKRLK